MRIYIVPNERMQSASFKEKNSSYVCPTGYVCTGRYHKGDENGTTQFEYASLKAITDDGKDYKCNITIGEVEWTEWTKEFSGFYIKVPDGCVIVGRNHNGDENGTTKYQSSLCYVGEFDNNGIDYDDISIVPNQKFISDGVKESISEFICPDNHVLIGRKHSGDENGVTYYEYASLKAINSQGQLVPCIVTIEDIESYIVECEGDSRGYEAPVNRVLVGRSHFGDEQKSTIYWHGVVKFNGYAMGIVDYQISEARKESSGYDFTAPDEYVMTGRHHAGDENGNTYYGFGRIKGLVTENIREKYKILLRFDASEKAYPMRPDDFIKLSRFRMHYPSGSDLGYNKVENKFDYTNSHDEEYYNIPVEIIDTYYVPDSSGIGVNLDVNMRPRDDKSAGQEEVFLEPDDNWGGDVNPEGRVPVYTYSTFGPDGHLRKEYWIFYGCNPTTFYSHQGDWEHIILDIANGDIVGVWISQHTGREYYKIDQISERVDGQQIINVYVDKSSHAHSRKGGSSYNKGYVWDITKCEKELIAQPWVHYAGAWGEVGWNGAATGPLGPLYKVLRSDETPERSLGNINWDDPESESVSTEDVEREEERLKLEYETKEQLTEDDKFTGEFVSNGYSDNECEPSIDNGESEDIINVSNKTSLDTDAEEANDGTDSVENMDKSEITEDSNLN